MVRSFRSGSLSWLRRPTFVFQCSLVSFGCGNVEPNAASVANSTENGTTSGSVLTSTEMTNATQPQPATSGTANASSFGSSTKAESTGNVSMQTASVARETSSTSLTTVISTADPTNTASEDTDEQSADSSEVIDASSTGPEPSNSGSEAVPSPGCSDGASDAEIANSVIDKPEGYDGAVPVPVLIAFHGAGGNASSLQGTFSADAKERGYLGVYLKSSGSAWSVRDDTPVLDAALDTIAENYCVDLNRVFAVGHSSGAQMITQLLCAGEDRFRAVAPVASSKYCNGWEPTPAIVIHGIDDIERGGQGENRYGLDDGDGRIDFGVYSTSNECGEASTAFEPGGNCGADIHPGCVEYDDCAVRTVFCNHDDPQYGTSNHGVPCFASQVMFDFFDEFE